MGITDDYSKLCKFYSDLGRPKSTNCASTYIKEKQFRDRIKDFLSDHVPITKFLLKRKKCKDMSELMAFDGIVNIAPDVMERENIYDILKEVFKVNYLDIA